MRRTGQPAGAVVVRGVANIFIREGTIETRFVLREQASFVLSTDSPLPSHLFSRICPQQPAPLLPVASAAAPGPSEPQSAREIGELQVNQPSATQAASSRLLVALLVLQLFCHVEDGCRPPARRLHRRQLLQHIAPLLDLRTATTHASAPRFGSADLRQESAMLKTSKIR